MSIDASGLAAQLIGGRNADGGWGYYRGKTSRLEPTAWSFLALAQQLAAELDLRALTTWPSTDGLLLEHAGGIPNYAFHGLALVVLSALGVEHVSGSAALVRGIQRVKGVALENGGANPTQDNRLQAWSWIAETFSWVEPTAWTLLSLKKRRQVAPREIDAARIAEAEKLMINRACTTGGWNYGNADVLGQDLRAYVPTTAIGVLAMQDRQDDAAIRRSVAFLESHGASEVSGPALALAAIALRIVGKDDAAVRARLTEQLPMTVDIGNHASLAMALYALSTSRYAALAL